MDKSDVLISNRNKYFAKVQKLHDLGKTIVELMTKKQSYSNELDAFISRYAKIEEDYSSFEAICDEIVLINVKRDTKDKIEVSQSSAAYDDLYFSVKTYARKFKVSQPQIAASDTSAKSQNTSNNQGQNAKLPKIHIEPFDGTITSWPNFYALFSTLIHKNKSLSPTEKLTYLRSLLKEPALSLIETYAISDENYELAFSVLLSRYQNKRLLASNYLNNIFSFQPLTKESLKGFNEFIKVFKTNMSALKVLDIGDISDFIILYLGLRALPSSTRKSFENEYPDNVPSFENLISFVQQQSRILELLPSSDDKSSKPLISNNREFKFKRSYTQSSLLSTVNKEDTGRINFKSLVCPYCDDPSHKIYACPKFKSLDVKRRLEFVKSKTLCFCCLGYHKKSCCKSTSRCMYCSGTHHSLIHAQRKGGPQIVKSNPTSDIEMASDVEAGPSQSLSCNVSNATSFVNVLLGTALIGIRDRYGKVHEVRALVDNGSQVSLISNSCVQKLGLKRHSAEISLVGLGETATPQNKGQVRCEISPLRSTNLVLRTHALIMPKISLDQPSIPVGTSVKKRFASITLADPNFDKTSPVDFLIGRDIYDDILLNSGTIKGPPSATPTIFGYIIGGKINEDKKSNSIVTSLLTCCESLNNSLRNFWELESVPTKSISCPEADLVDKKFEETVSRDNSGRYIVSLPFKYDPPKLPYNRNIAHNRLINLESRLRRTPRQYQEYRKFMDEYISLGHMSLSTSPVDYVIPHHCVLKVDSSTTKLRTVFDASFKPKSEDLSLNDNLYPGPKLINDIVHIIINFRLGAFVLCADIKQMYRQILISPDQRDFQHIFYRTEPNGKIDEYTLNTVTYGIKSSSYLALKTLIQLVKDEGNMYPFASRAVLENTFVDDICTSVETPDEVITLQDELVALFSKGCFTLRKWVSNYQPILDKVPEEDREQTFVLKDEDSPAMKILGLRYEPCDDSFSYSINLNPVVGTKRSLLSEIARIYDPLGWLAPLTLYAKHLLQRTWQLGIDWDQILPVEIKEKWEHFISTLPMLSKIKIPRLTSVTNVNLVHIVGFCDASEIGYAANLYLRTESEKEIKMHLIIAKTRVAPLKQLSIPRLELTAAHLLSKLFKYIKPLIPKLNVNSVIFFSDSTVTLAWLRTPPHRLKTFVANRVVDILEETRSDQWRHVRSYDNPCDCASRGLTPDKLKDNTLWWHGPNFLYQPIDSWNINTPLNDLSSIPELKLETFILTKNNDNLFEDIIKKYSSLSKIQRISAYILRFSYNCRCSKNNLIKRSGILTVNELRQALAKCIYMIQDSNLRDVIIAIKENKPTPPKYRSLCPFLDEEGFVRVGGRLQFSKLSYSSKHPLLIPKDTALASLICDHYHRLSLHSGPRLTQSLIQQRYWIVSLRRLLKEIIFKCVRCHKFKAKPLSQQMAPLPPVRFETGRAFLNTGVDYAGPIAYKESDRRKAHLLKGYIAIFVCLSTKAVHLEFVTSLSTPAFLATLDRFIARRGLCKKLYSDCGSNFKGAAHYFDDVIKFLKESDGRIGEYLAAREIEFIRNVPHAPHWGGLWERGVQSAKYHMNRVMGNLTLTYEEMSTLLARIEAVLNSRPLGAISADPNDELYLSPGHFLIGNPLLTPPEVDLVNIPMNRLSRYRLLQQATQSFWKRWSQDYLQTLTPRPKWSSDEKNIEVGDIIYLRINDTNPLEWPIGRVVETFPGRDGRVRAASVRTSTGEYRRPINKLIPLPPV